MIYQTKSDGQNVEKLCNKINTKGRRFKRKENCKKGIANGLPLRNRFATLEEDNTKTRLNVIDQQTYDKMFFIGKKSIFKAEKGRK